jgi:quercetin dioxygenase-like cupin family protein
VAAPRRVVTGHDAAGRSVVLSDGPAPRSHDVGPAVFHEVWSTRATPAPIAATEPEPTDRPLVTPPDPGGSIVRITEIKPGERSPMHRTESIDYGIVLEGELWLVLDDGSETRLGPGDVVVQRGTDHAWENRGERTVRVVFVLVDGAFTDELRAAIGAPQIYDQPLDS